MGERNEREGVSEGEAAWSMNHIASKGGRGYKRGGGRRRGGGGV